jgi:hypothetical protein
VWKPADRLPMARTRRASHSAVQRIGDAHGLQAHRVKTFGLSKDKRFVVKPTDRVGLYLNPPDNAVVCMDENSHIQGKRPVNHT